MLPLKKVGCISNFWYFWIQSNSLCKVLPFSLMTWGLCVLLLYIIGFVIFSATLLRTLLFLSFWNPMILRHIPIIRTKNIIGKPINLKIKSEIRFYKNVLKKLLMITKMICAYKSSDQMVHPGVQRGCELHGSDNFHDIVPSLLWLWWTLCKSKCWIGSKS